MLVLFEFGIDEQVKLFFPASRLAWASRTSEGLALLAISDTDSWVLAML